MTEKHAAPHPKSFHYEERDAIATITLDRPERKNALTFEVYRELRDTFRTLAHRTAVRSIIITGRGDGFCTGGDVKDIIGVLLKQPTEELLDFTRLTCDLIRSLRECPTPIVAALNGVVAGAGAVIALASDFRIGCDEARVAFLFSKVGLAGSDMGAAYLLPKIVGMGRATEILMLGEFISAHDALHFGLYNQLVPHEQVASAARILAEKLRDGPQFATRMTKTMLEQESSMSLVQALEAEAQAQAICMHNRDYREYFDAFTATPRRKPVFFRKEGGA